MTYRRKRKKRILPLLFLLLILIGAGYIYTAPEFERVPPKIEKQKNIFWNKSKPFSIHLSDNLGLKKYKLTLSDGTHSIELANKNFKQDVNDTKLNIFYPKESILNETAKELFLDISVNDKSMWNFLQGNHTIAHMKIIIDHKRPTVNILSNSYSIVQGGAALVIFQVIDTHLKQVYVQVSEHKFQAVPYKKSGYYAALIAWPFNENDFHAKVVAIDKAQNKRIEDVPLYLKSHNYRTSWIKAKDSFIDGKITDLASSTSKYAKIDNRLEKLKSINETMRLNNEALIHSLSKVNTKTLLTSWKINKFYPLKNAAKVASFGDHRYYYYKDKEHKVSESYHVGYDLASTKMAPIITSNNGKVVYADDNGIYGNMPMIDHGLGLYSLYGHCSQLLVKKGDTVKAGQVIAKTGKSGLALGDHLHFGLVVQGIEVRPIEWFDANWIRKNIENVFKEADKIISGQ